MTGDPHFPGCGKEAGVRYFWTDDNSNYCGLYVGGRLKGRLCVFDHDAPDLTPRFRSLRSFWHHWLDAHRRGVEWHEMGFDYPPSAPGGDPADTGRDRADARWYLQVADNAETEDERNAAPFYAMALAPHEDHDTVLRFAWHEDMWVQERACQQIGLRRYAFAVPLLREAAVRGMHNGRTAARIALARIATPEALDALVSLGELTTQQAAAVTERLRQGFEVQVQYRRCRRPGRTEWESIG